MLHAAILGCGFIAETHVEALRSSRILIDAVVGRTMEKAKAFAEKWEIPSYGTDMELLFAEQIDCVHVCTPPGNHYETVKALLLHGKHVLCEKPLCLSNAEALELAAIAEEKHAVCAVNFNVRFHDACQKAKAIVESPDFGRVLLIHGSYLQEFGAMPSLLDWRYQEAAGGKLHAVSEIGSHWMDLAQYISGKQIQSVSANFGCFWPARYEKDQMLYPDPVPDSRPFAVSSEDAAIISFRFAGGAIGAVTLSEVSQGRYNHLSLEITGERQTLWWNAETNNLLCFAEKGSAVRSIVCAFGNGFTDTFRSLIREVYRDIASGGPSKCPAYPTVADGARNVLLCSAVWESAQNDSRWTALPESAGKL